MPQRKVPALILVGVAAGLLIFGVITARSVGGNKLADPEKSASQHAAQLTQYRPNEKAPEMKALMLSALKGSPDAASHLSALYAHCHYGEPTKEEFAGCASKGRYWAEIAAENGSPVGMSYQIINLITTRKCTDAHRAEFWLGRLAAAQSDFPSLGALSGDVANATKNCS